jgi:hypothetical protein
MLADTTTVVGTVATILGIVIGVLSTIAVYRLQSRPKQLDYEFILGVRLLATEAARLEGDLKVQYGQRKVTEPYLLLVRLINTGNKSIDPRDFDQPVRVELGSTEVVTAGIVKKSNSEMRTRRPEVGSGVVLIYPILFEPGEWIAFTILTDGEPPEREVVARISGGREPRPFKSRQSPERSPYQQAAGIIPAVLVGILGFNLENIVGARLFPGWDAPQGSDTPASLYVFVAASVIVILGASVLTYNILIRRIDSARKRRIEDLDIVS